MEPKTFVIGDAHGHVDRFMALMVKAGAVRANMDTGMIERNPDVEVIQLGDLGQFDEKSVRGDRDCYELAKALGVKVLWGNHDRAAVDWQHQFMGFAPVGPEMIALMNEVIVGFALVRHGYLITHAGLSKAYAPFGMKPHALALKLNDLPSGDRAINGIGYLRGGHDDEGGILWRDERESLAPLPQIFGHTRGLIRQWEVGGHKQWCIDVGAKTGDSLAGLLLPDERIIAVGSDAEQHEKYPPQEGV